MSFSAAWLALREPVDAAARSRALALRFAAALPRAAIILDLGAGTGANARALAPLIGGEPTWLLAERDAALLGAASGGRSRLLPIDLARETERLTSIACDGVAASAFFDLVSAEWLAIVTRWIAARHLPLLASLTVDGRRDWRPALALDEMVGAAFRRHQARDKGFGPALGPAAPERLAASLGAAGCTVATVASDWRLGACDGALLAVLVAAEAAAATAAAPQAAVDCAAWARQRMEQLHAGQLTLTVGHRDVLALPPAPAR